MFLALALVAYIARLYLLCVALLGVSIGMFYMCCKNQHVDDSDVRKGLQFLAARYLPAGLPPLPLPSPPVGSHQHS